MTVESVTPTLNRLIRASEIDRLVCMRACRQGLGQRIGNNCVGADFSSNVTLSGKLHGIEHKLILDDLRIDALTMNRPAMP